MSSIKDIIIKTKEGEAKAKARKWSKKDLPVLRRAFKNWRKLVMFVKRYGGRGANFPEFLSEALFCIATGSVQVIKVKGKIGKGFDCYDEKTQKRQQVKGSSRIDSPSSFGPHEKFDEVPWVVLIKDEEEFTGEFEIYNIPGSYIKQHPNFKRNMPAGKRPRFLLLDIVKDKKIKPMKRGKLL